MSDVKIPRTLKELAQEALDVQNACNPMGVSKGFARSLQELSDRLKLDGKPNDTPAMRSHPIHQLWASKIHDLAGMGMSNDERYGEAYKECNQLAGTPGW